MKLLRKFWDVVCNPRALRNVCVLATVWFVTDQLAYASGQKYAERKQSIGDARLTSREQRAVGDVQAKLRTELVRMRNGQNFATTR